MLEDEVFVTLSGERIEIRESGTEFLQLVAITIYDGQQSSNPIEAFMVPNEALALAEKLTRFANAAKTMQPNG